MNTEPKHPKSTSKPNPMRWDCERQGCFNNMKRPKIERFHDCFPRTVQMSDIDGEVELNSHWLRIEWKGTGKPINGGQKYNYERLTKGKKHTVLVCYGDAETMEIWRVDVFWDGQLREDVHEIRDMEQLRNMMYRWAAWAEGPFS